MVSDIFREVTTKLLITAVSLPADVCSEKHKHLGAVSLLLQVLDEVHVSTARSSILFLFFFACNSSRIIGL